MSDIFISYSSEDRARIRPLVAALEERGWSVWWDRTIPPGKVWEEVIEEAIHQARCVVVLWSNLSVRSEWVKKEARTGRERRILVPALIDKVAVPWAFSEFQAANLAGWKGEAEHLEFRLFVAAIAAIVPVKVDVEKERAAAVGVGAEEAPKMRIPPQVVEPPKPFRWDAPAQARPAQARVNLGFARRWLIAGGVPVVVLVGALMVWKVYTSGPLKTPDPERANVPRVAVKAPDVTPVPVRANGQRVAGETSVNPKDGQTYVWIPPGKFLMGCSPGDSECYEVEKPQREVSINKGFWLGQTEVTQAAWKRVMKTEPSHFKGENRPVENITMDQARQYCTAVGGRLPTEAEWEYAARAGTTGARYGDLDKIAWYRGNSNGETHEVKQKQPNAWGLYDMLGNVWEWVEGEQNLRGGSWGDLPRYVRASGRYRFGPGDLVLNVGARCRGEFSL